MQLERSSNAPAMRFEAEWDTDGAVCIERTRFDTRCERAADHDEMWTCNDSGHWQLARACRTGNCYATGNGAGCPD